MHLDIVLTMKPFILFIPQVKIKM